MIHFLPVPEPPAPAMRSELLELARRLERMELDLTDGGLHWPERAYPREVDIVVWALRQAAR